MPEMAARIVYEFSNFRLDPQQRLLLCGADQRPVPLPPKVFETLLYFVERRGELLEKGTLLKAIWPNVVVEENSLNQNISTLRRVLGESPGEHRYIATEPGRGYRFVADVRTVVAPGAAQVTSDRPAAVASVGAAAPERKSIAVLPFANLTGDPAKEYLSDGMAEELIHMLARVPGLKVPARTSSFAYKGRNTDVRQIARDLGVATVLEGSVRGASERIRITAQLIDGQSGYHLWSQSYDREFGDLFKLQDELANAIVATLRATLDGKLPGRVHLEAPTRDLTAYQLYLQAQAMQVVGGEPVLRSAVEMLKAAITRDPRFARAYTALATLRAVAIVQGFKLAGTVADTERELQQAVTLDPGPGATHAALGIMHAVQGKWLSAEEQFQEAIARDREDPATWQAHGMHVTGSAGHLKRYLDDALEAHRLAPVWMGNLLNLAVACMLEERLEEARKHLESGISLGLPPTMTPIADVLSQLEAREGRPAAGATPRSRA
jgi:adenylate cyclase